jgi:hypothetical protein
MLIEGLEVSILAESLIFVKTQKNGDTAHRTHPPQSP